MAVYTDVSDDELNAFLDGYNIGSLVSLKGIAEGVENSNFVLETGQGQFILTLYEKRVKLGDLPFFLGLMEHLAAKGIACPTPIRRNDGAVLGELCGRPAAIVSFLMAPRPLATGPAALRGAMIADRGRGRIRRCWTGSWSRPALPCPHRCGSGPPIVAPY